MPKAATINPDLIRILFDYNPETGHLTPKPTTTRCARRVNSKQWEINGCQFSIHRLVWAWHHHTDAKAANPRYIKFKDGDRTNTRIENLEGHHQHPRWENHKKQRRVRLDENGNIMSDRFLTDVFESKFDFQ